MNITFILGNGFDLQLGLKSHYSDFVNEYVNCLPGDSENIKRFKKELEADKTQEFWSDVERAMGMHLGQYSNTNVPEFVERIEDFESRMIEYLEVQQNLCSYDAKAKIKNAFTKFIFESHNDVLVRRSNDLNPNQAGSNTYNFITFNYTNLIDRIITCCRDGNSTIRIRNVNGSTYSDSFSNAYHVHGTLNSQIIMGVNDESQLNLSGGISLTDELCWDLIKPRLNAESRNNWDVPAKKAIEKSDIIYIYGVSYGETDLLWWQEIAKWLIQDSKHKLVAFIRDEKGFNSRIPWAEINYDLAQRREILRKLAIEESDEQYEALIEQIYIILNTKRLTLKSILIPSDSNNESIAASANQSTTVVV